ncbi:MAG: DUF600 family protein [Clostridia bacterium]|nr:DUF600 family protein [Clostridia bacterium]
MDISNEERNVFSEIQKKLFYMIPQKWDAIYLFASISQESFKNSNGEMFFYYYPKGILKKNPINVYEIPSLFNIDDETYNELVNMLFSDIKRLYGISRIKHPAVWTSITIIIEGAQFKIEYNYDDLEKEKYFDHYERHVIWRYEYLNLDFDSLTKKEKDIINRYNNSIMLSRKPKEVYSEGMYKQITHNIIDYAKTISIETAIALQKDDEKKKSSHREKLDFLKGRKKKVKDSDVDSEENSISNNQILSGIKKKIDDDEFDYSDELLTSEVMSGRENREIYIEEKDDEIDDLGDELLTSEVMSKRVNKKIKKD